MRCSIVLASLVIVGVVGCSPPERDASQWPIARNELERSAAASADPGARAYRRTCIACHMSDGKGNNGTTAADLTRPDGILTHPDDDVRAVIRDGRRGTIGVMPAHGAILTASELDDVLAYVRRELAPNVHVLPAASVPVDAGPPTP